MYKYLLLITMIVFSSISEEVGLKNIFNPDSIDVSIPYSSGIIDITPFDNHQQKTFIFSNGTTFSIKSLHGWSIMMDAYYGALDVEDSMTRAFYKHDTNIVVTYDYYGGSNNWSLKWLYSISFGIADTVWEKAIAFPNSLSPFDSIAIEENDTTATFLQGKCYAINIEDEFNPGMFWDEYPLEYYNAIFYLSGPDNIHFKLQVFDYEIYYGPNSSAFIYVHLRWAIDSCGNKQFMPSTSISTANKHSTDLNYFPLKIANQNGKLTISDNCYERNTILKVFDLKGRIVFNKIIKHNINLNLNAGIYLLQVNIGNKKYYKKMSIL